MTFEQWFEEHEPNGQMRCDNIYDKIADDVVSLVEIYDFVESMMMVAYCAGVTDAGN